MARARREDDGIVGEVPVTEEDPPAVQVHALDLGQEDRDVSRMAQDGAKRARDVGRRERRRGHLIEERLEQMVVSTVQDGDANGTAGQPARRVQAAEAAPDDHDVRHGVVTTRRSLFRARGSHPPSPRG